MPDYSLYQVAPSMDDCDWDQDGPVVLDLYVLAADPSDAIKHWRKYYADWGLKRGIGVTNPVRVFKVPVAGDTAESGAVSWDSIEEYSATIKTFSVVEKDDD